MKKIDKLVLKSFFGPFFLSFAVGVFILLLRLILLYIDDIFGKDLGLLYYGKLFFYFSFITVPIALPLAMLFAALLTFGNLGEYFELTAIKSAGISISRVMRPMFFIAVLLSIFLGWFNNVALPWANLKGFRLLHDIKTTKATLNIEEGVFYTDLPGYAIKVGKKLPDNKTLKDVVIYDHNDNGGNKHVILADSALMYTINNKQHLVFELFNGNDYMEDPDHSSMDNTDLVKHGFKRFKIVTSLSAFDMHNTEEQEFSHHPIMKNVIKLEHDADSIKNDINKSKQLLAVSAEGYYTFLLQKKDTTKHIDASKINFKLLENARMKPLTKANLEFVENQNRTLLAFAETNKLIIKDGKSHQLKKTNLEWHHKFTTAFSIFVMFLIGAPLGAIIKKGGFGMPIVIAVVFFTLMHIFTQQGDKMAIGGKVLLPFGAWLGNIILLNVGIYLLINARNDARVFDADMYRVCFNRFKERFQRFGFKNKWN